MARIAVISGSTRAGSFNTKLGKVASNHLKSHGADVTWVDLSDYELPIYSHEIEIEQFPADALRLKNLLIQQDGMLFIAPEYNGSVPPVLKNAIDWASRPTGDEGLVALTAYRGKAAAIMAASVSPFGGLRGLMHMRQILTTVQMLVIPEQVVVPNAHTAFDDDGLLTDKLAASLVEMTTARLVKVSNALAG